MTKLLQLILLSQNILLILATKHHPLNVVLTKNEYLSVPNRTSFQLKCVYNLEKDKQCIQRVDISKDKRVFYSVEYLQSQHYHQANTVDHGHHGNSHNETPHMDLINHRENQIQPDTPSVAQFKKGSGIRELLRNVSAINHNLNEGWTLIQVKLFHDKPITGSYRCKVHYLEDKKQHHIESDRVDIDSKREEVKFQLNHGRERFGKNKNIDMECKYKLLKQDKFRGLSLTKNNQEFFRFFNNKNHSFVPVLGVNHVTWTSHAKSIQLTVKKAQNTTSGLYACIFKFSVPNSEEKESTMFQSARIIFKSSKENRFSNSLAKTWILLLLLMVYIIY